MIRNSKSKQLKITAVMHVVVDVLLTDIQIKMVKDQNIIKQYIDLIA